MKEMSKQLSFAWWNTPEYMERPKIGSRKYKKESEVYYGKVQERKKKKFQKERKKDNYS